MKKIDLKNRITIKGKGQPVVLAHGMAGPKVWEPIIEQLSEHFTVIVPTFPGYIETDGVIQYSDELYVDFLEEVRIKLGYEQWCVIGISMGGRTVLNYALQHEKRVTRIIVIDSAGLNNFSPMFTLPIIKKLAPKLIAKMLTNSKNVKKLALEDLVYKEGSIAS
ncbi:MAG: alpha/beta fold hydrolase, partial [Bacteroidota bacterium]|nr:alpha/beta fold hydrolase [Bacteroidota bacterium]